MSKHVLIIFINSDCKNIAPVADEAAKLQASQNKERISQQASTSAPCTHHGANPTSKPETLTS